MHYTNLGDYENGRVTMPASLLVKAETLWPDPAAEAAHPATGSAEIARHALVMLDHVRRALQVAVDANAFASGGAGRPTLGATPLTPAARDAAIQARVDAAPLLSEAEAAAILDRDQRATGA